MPLIHRPGEAQTDFGYALAKEDGRLRKAVLFVMSLQHSDAVLVQMFDRICTEVFWEAHRRAFEFFGGVPRRTTYDNEGVMVAQVIGARKRKLTNGPLQLQSHYLFGEHFCLMRLPFEAYTEVLGSERLTGALLDRLTHRIHVLEANGESYRLRESKRRLARRTRAPRSKQS